MFIIREGSVNVLKKDENGSEAHIATLGKNNYFGEMALITENPRTATIQTIEPCEYLSLSKEDFMELISSEPSIAKKMSDSTIERTFYKQ